MPKPQIKNCRRTTSAIRHIISRRTAPTSCISAVATVNFAFRTALVKVQELFKSERLEFELVWVQELENTSVGHSLIAGWRLEDVF